MVTVKWKCCYKINRYSSKISQNNMSKGLPSPMANAFKVIIRATTRPRCASIGLGLPSATRLNASMLTVRKSWQRLAFSAMEISSKSEGVEHSLTKSTVHMAQIVCSVTLTRPSSSSIVTTICPTCTHLSNCTGTHLTRMNLWTVMSLQQTPCKSFKTFIQPMLS